MEFVVGRRSMRVEALPKGYVDHIEMRILARVGS